ncbi:MAG TPA: PIG-L deacetylase family protein [Anaerolineaceae bacterium]
MTFQKIEPEGWDSPQKILVILAHPDDPEFFFGATISRWVKLGNHVEYCILTRGEKGAPDRTITPYELAIKREIEQKAAAASLGVQNVQFLGYQDGYLLANLDTRRAVVRVIRQVKPTIVVSSDPLNYFPSDVSINHPDHRTAGQILADAVFPAAGNAFYFPELITEGYEPHSVKEVWFSLTTQPNLVIDVTNYWDDKTNALLNHQSQIREPDKFIVRMRSRHTPDSNDDNPRYEEKFRRIKFS